MSGGHTPGPWSVHPYSTPEWMGIPAGPHGGAFSHASLGIGAGEKLLARVEAQTANDRGGWPQVEDLAEMRANANLVIAAPELLTAAKRARRSLATAVIANSGGIFSEADVHEHEVVGALDAAIAKATGAA